MSDIALYNTLKKIPGITDAEAKEAAADVASTKDVATKDYIDSAIAKLEARILRQQMVIAGVLLAGMALLKFI